MTPGPLLALAAASFAASLLFGYRQARAWLALTVMAAVAALIAALLVLLAPLDWEWRSSFTLCGELLHLRLDGISALFLALLCVVGGAGAVYAHEYWSDERHPDSAPRGRVWWSAIVASLGMVLLASNGLHFLIAWETFTISAYFLITLDRTRSAVRQAGWLYLAASHVGAMCLFAFFASIAARTGSWDLGPMREHAELAPLFWLALVGFGLKAGMFPLHVWLPSAHASAPSHVSAIMSGVAIKMGIYGLVRFSGWMPIPAAAGWVIVGLGAASALLGIAFALAQNDLKRLLAYCSVENVGIILVGFGAALLAMAHGNALWGRLALAGALLHVWNHGAFKSLLFFAAGSVLHATGTREMSRLGGLWRRMPWTAALFAIGALAVAGLPPLNGFVSEWLVVLGLLDAATSKGPSAWAAVPAAIVLAMAGAMALAAFVKAGSIVFLGAPRTRTAAAAHESGWWMRAPMIALGGACAIVGLAPILLWSALSRAVATWNPAWPSAAPNAPLTTLGAANTAIALAAVAAAIWLWRKAHSHGLRRSLTWDCGYAAPTARMQYTSSSFAAVVTGWFGWVLREESTMRRLRGPFPSKTVRVQRIPETVLERMVVPAGEVILRAAQVVRRLQHGRLQAYVLYLVVGLVALSVLVWLAAAA